MAKQKLYPLKGEAENAANLNAYQAYSKNFRKNLPKDKVPAPKYKKNEVPAARALQIADSLKKKSDLGSVLATAKDKMAKATSRQDTLNALAGAYNGSRAAEANRIKSNRVNAAAKKAMAYAGAYANQEKKRVAAPDATSVARISVPLAETQFHK